jgi:chromosome segregation ATPase
MTKLEELTALLVNEINDFRNGVEKLEKMNEYLKDTKIKIDLTNYKSIIEKHEQKMKSHTKAIERFESRFENKIKHAKMYPTWAVMVFVASTLFGTGLILFCFLFR